MPKVSVIIPVYNVEKCLRQCLDSVVNQTLKDIEIICVNDGSPDNCGDILKEYANKDNRIIVINQQNQGCDVARRNGLTRATGEYIALLDSDDYIDENYYKELYNVAKKYNADMSATDQVIVKCEGKTYTKYVGINKKAKLLQKIEDKGQLIIATGLVWNKLYKKSFIEKYKIDVSSINTAAGDNYFSAVATIFADKIAITHKAIYYYIIRSNSMTQSYKKKKDFSVTDVYNSIYDRVEQSVLTQKEQDKWATIINLRKHKDYNNYFKTMSPELKKRV